jgi:hypothetical protein
MATPTENWPKTYLLQVHEQAVANGFIWIKPISEADAKSLRDRLYRIRRRSDTSMAAYIPPEYHLVMIGVWEEEDGGRLPIIFDRRPDGLPLPSIVVPSGEEVEAYIPAPRIIEPSPPIDVESLDVTIDEDDIGSYVDNLRKRAAKKEQGDG